MEIFSELNMDQCGALARVMEESSYFRPPPKVATADIVESTIAQYLENSGIAVSIRKKRSIGDEASSSVSGVVKHTRLVDEKDLGNGRS